MAVLNSTEPAHTQRGPSGYSRWSVCTASPAAIEDAHRKGLIPVDNSSEYSREGTVAHYLLETALTIGCSPRDWIGEELYVPDLKESFIISPEMGEETDKAYEYICAFIGEGAILWVENKLKLDNVTPGEKGTADIVTLVQDGLDLVLHVMDFKYGAGIPVPVENNGQMQLYTIGAFDQLLDYEQRKKVSKIFIHVVQPRMGNIAAWEVTKGQLEKFRVEANGKFKITKDPLRREFVPGSHCRFCDFKTRCRTLKESIYKWAIEDESNTGFDGFRSPETMTDDQLAELWPMLDFFSAWASNMKKYMDTEAARGREFKNLKLRAGTQGKRQWKNAADAEFYLLFEEGLSAAQAYNQELLSPAQAEKLIGRKKLDQERFAELVTRTDAKPTLALANDPRPSYQQIMADEFDD